MLEGSSDWKGKGRCLGYYITTELELWIKECPAVQQVRRRESRRGRPGERRGRLICVSLECAQSHFVP